MAIVLPIGVDYLWSGALSIFGFDIDVPPLLIKGKQLKNGPSSRLTLGSINQSVGEYYEKEILLLVY